MATNHAMVLRLLVMLTILSGCLVAAFKSRMHTPRLNRLCLSSTTVENPPANDVSAKTVTKEIMAHFASRTTPTEDEIFAKRLQSNVVSPHIDGLNVLTLLFQCARTRKRLDRFLNTAGIIKILEKWDREWNERDISTFMYGVQALECIDPADSELLRLAAKKIAVSTAKLSSRAIGNALYGLHRITSDTAGVPELSAALAGKIKISPAEISGQDIGIALYGIQGLSASLPEIGVLVEAVAEKVAQSDADLDAQALSNALYGLQSLSSDHPEVLKLVSALSTKVSEARPELCAQAIGSALFGLQRLSSDALEVRTLVAALAEKVDVTTVALDAQAIGNALFGLQRMKSSSAEVRSLISALNNKITTLDAPLDAKGIGEALYGLRSMSSDVPQVRNLLSTLADRINQADCELNGQGIADALYGMYSMTTDCKELRKLLAAVSNKINAKEGKLEAQEIGNALFGLQGVSTELPEVREIVGKLAQKISRSRAILRAQHIGRALLGLQRFSAEYSEVRSLIKELTKRIADSDRTRLTGQAMADALYGLQGLSSKVPEVQELVGEIAKKIAQTAAPFTSEQLGRALYGLQGLSSDASIFVDSAIGLDADEVSFLLSTLWDKVKVRKEGMTLRAIGLGLQGLVSLRDPIANNLRQYLYLQLLKVGLEKEEQSLAEKLLSVKQGELSSTSSVEGVSSASSSSSVVAIQRADATTTNTNVVTSSSSSSFMDEEPTKQVEEDIFRVYRALHLNQLQLPRWIVQEYQQVVKAHVEDKPLNGLSRADKAVVQKYRAMYPRENVTFNAVLEGFTMDLWFPDILLNIELDGPGHRLPTRQRFDQQRDAFLTQSQEIIVRRMLSSASRKVEDVIAEIVQVVNQIRDQQSEQAVQQLYAANRDRDIQRLYAPSSSASKNEDVAGKEEVEWIDGAEKAEGDRAQVMNMLSLLSKTGNANSKIMNSSNNGNKKRSFEKKKGTVGGVRRVWSSSSNKTE